MLDEISCDSHVNQLEPMLRLEVLPGSVRIVDAIIGEHGVAVLQT